MLESEREHRMAKRDKFKVKLLAPSCLSKKVINLTLIVAQRAVLEVHSRR